MLCAADLCKWSHPSSSRKSDSKRQDFSADLICWIDALMLSIPYLEDPFLQRLIMSTVQQHNLCVCFSICFLPERADTLAPPRDFYLCVHQHPATLAPRRVPIQDLRQFLAQRGQGGVTLFFRWHNSTAPDQYNLH